MLHACNSLGASALPSASTARWGTHERKCINPITTSTLHHTAGGAPDRLLHGTHISPTKSPAAPHQQLNNIRCAAAPPKQELQMAPPKTSLLQELHEQGHIQLELSINKATTYSWPLQHTLVLRVVSSAQVDPDTGEGAVSSPVVVYFPPGEATVKLHVNVPIPQGFGKPAALLLASLHSEEFFLESVSWSTPTNPRHSHHFWCNSWVTQTKNTSEPRIFFTNEVFLPNQTPPGLAQFRQAELNLLRGDGTGRRHLGERIYDYDVYNDLGDPDTDPAKARPVLGGSQDLPYPRRCRTGREHTKTDPKSEGPELDAPIFYVPRDEQFSATKQQIIDGTTAERKAAVTLNLRADLISAAARNSQQTHTFESLEEIFALYVNLFPWPPILQDKDAWWTDEEFARQRLAGLNPVMIERLKAFPIVSSLDPQIYGDPTSAITAQDIVHNLEGLTVEEALSQKKIFILDYHDALLPVLPQVNSSSDTYVYATRTLFFLTHEGSLKPIAIELSSSPAEDHDDPHKRVFTPPTEPIHEFPGDNEATWLWQLAKAHVAVNDTGYHQLISHWLRTHCSLEPFVIATHRQLSALHPIYRLLLPHFKDTMSINGQARKNLINSDGIIESSFFPRELCMRFSSLVYKNWRFDEEGLPQDLIKRGMAEKNENNELTMTIKNYPYAVDGLELWALLESWVQEYVNIYYQNDQTVQNDDEIQKWWWEIKEIGHGDHREAEWWGAMDSKDRLKQTLLTIIWLAAGHHAAVNFGQYAYAGFMPNSPSVARRAIPSSPEDMQELDEDPEEFYLSSLATQQEAMVVMATLQLLSTHIEDEFLGESMHAHWTSDPKAVAAFRKFGKGLKQVEANIEARNQDPTLQNNRYGLAQMPYKLLFPSSEQGMTFQGVPNSISI